MTKTVVCCLCFEPKRLEELSLAPDGNLTDTCLVCLQKEMKAILDLIVPLLGVGRSILGADNEITREVSITTLPCGHVTTCWCVICHVCEDVLDDS